MRRRGKGRVVVTVATATEATPAASRRPKKRTKKRPPRSESGQKRAQLSGWKSPPSRGRGEGSATGDGGMAGGGAAPVATAKPVAEVATVRPVGQVARAVTPRSQPPLESHSLRSWSPTSLGHRSIGRR